MIRQILDLIDAEHRIGAQEWNGAFDFVAMLIGLGLRDLVCIDHHRSALAFADVTAEFERLLERHPDRRREAARDGFRPQQDDVDALIGHAVVAQRPRDAPSRVGRIPWLDPGTHTAFEIGDDAIGDARVDVGARVLFLPAHFQDLHSGGRACRGPSRGAAAAAPGVRAPDRAAAQRRTAKPLRVRRIRRRTTDREGPRWRDAWFFRFA